MKVSQFMTKSVRTCTQDTPLIQVAKLMSEVNCGIVPVVGANRQLVGLITDRDIVLRAVAQGADVNSAQAGQFMTQPVAHCSPETDAHEAASLMAQMQIRRLPVVSAGLIVGIVALGDLATIQIHVNEAGDALSAISTPSAPGAH
jgi:CBS domain-containing protein